MAFAALFGFGLLNALLGPLLPYLRQSEHLGYVAGALHQVAFAIGGMAAGIQASRSTAPRRRTIVVGLGAAAACTLLLGYGAALALTLTAAFLISALASAALIRVWALLADLHHVHRVVAMTEGEIAVSLAGIAMPAVVGICAATALGWRFSSVVAVVVVIIAAAAVRATRLPDATPPRDGDGAGVRPGPAHRRTLGTVFAVVGAEFTITFWAATFLHDEVGITRNVAVGLLSTLYAANLVGRLAMSRLARRWRATTLLRASLATTLAGAPLLIAADSVALAAAGLVVAGIGIGGLFPLASSLHVSGSGRSADQALGEILAVAGIGQIIGPLAVGALAQASGLRLGMLAFPVLLLIAAATTYGTNLNRTR